MGLGTQSDSIYLSISCGFMKNKNKNIQARWVSGLLTDIYEKEDSYEGQPTHKIYVKIRDKAESYLLQFTKDGWYSYGFFQRIGKVDLSKEITIGVSSSDKNDKLSFCWMKQGDQKVEKDENFPPTVKSTFKGKEYTEFPLAEFDRVIKEIKESIPGDPTSNVHYVKEMVDNVPDAISEAAGKMDEIDAGKNKKKDDSELPF